MTDTRGSTATPERGRSQQDKKGLFARIALFFRQVVAEIRKVVWPTRTELITYTTVVLVFVVSFAALVLVFDIGVSKAVKWVFG
ncbi:MAG TPA: preprotein translocase subunit SecE [Actinomycetes bacterium]|nr:preprotein translocase subunit SecE [Actinomycetes bacterium]